MRGFRCGYIRADLSRTGLRRCLRVPSARGDLVETLRIAIITETLPANRLNLQPWRYLGDLAQSLQLEGHEVSVVTSDDTPSDWNGVPITRHANPTDFRSALALRDLLDRRRFDAGLCRLTAGLFFSARGRAREASSSSKLAGIFLRPLHDGRDLARRFLDPLLAPEIPMDLHHAAMFGSRVLGTWPDAAGSFDDFVFLWESDRARGTSAGLPAEACHVIRHPFDPFFRAPSAGNSALPIAEALPGAGRRIVFSGPPEESRGVADVVRLVGALPPDPPTQVLLLLRDGRFPRPVVDRTRIGTHELVVVRGLLSRDEIRWVYRHSDGAVFPYRWVRTALPLVALEAAAAGLPVVTTRVHPLRELEGPSGLVFANPRDPLDLARAVRGAVDANRREAIRRKNEEWIRSTPDWRAVAQTFVSLLRGPTPGRSGARVLEPSPGSAGSGAR